MSDLNINQSSQPRDLTSIVFAVLIIGVLMSMSFWIVRPFLPALIWAATIVIASWRGMLAVQRRLRNRRPLAVLVMAVIQMLVIILPLSIAFVAIIDNIGTASDEVRHFFAHGIPDPPRWLADTPVVGPRLVKWWNESANVGKDEAIAKLAPFAGQSVSWLVDQIGSFGMILVHFILTVILSAVLYAKGEVAAASIMRLAHRLGQERGEQAVILAAQAIRAVASGVIVTALIQGVMAGVGLAFAGVPYALILGSLAFLLSVIQVGAGPILIGAVIWLFYYGSGFAAWAFLIWSVIIMAADNFIRPYLIKRGADLPLILIFAGVIGGLLSFGIIGIFVGPVVLAVSYTLLQAWIGHGRISPPVSAL